MAYRIGIDTGGTFTDLVVFDTESGQTTSLKVPSTPREPLQAFIGAIQEARAAPDDFEYLVHGTTVATNALIERKGARVAFVTTAGFEDIPYIQRVNRRELYNLDWDKPRPLLKSRRDCFGVHERVDHHGQVLQPLSADEVRSLIRRIKAEGYGVVAVCLLFAYLNTEHEQLFRQVLQEEAPDLPLTLSHEVAPIWREYERASTAIADAFLKPLLQRYVASLERGLAAIDVNLPWTLMKSNGGIMRAAAGAEQPIQLAMSGPAGGMVASQHLAEVLGITDVLTIDIGGTSADVGIITEGRQKHTTEYEIEWGLPAAIPLIDIKTIGAGGGSIAWLDNGGLLQVGPHSAGADPGPVAYDNGGLEPTITDANLTLGRLDPDYFLAGKLKLNKPKAEARLAELAARLHMDAVGLASAIVEIANENMANAIRMVSIERGHDPRKFALFAFGGAGPLHGAAIARKLGVPRVVVPLYPGATCAMGLLMADLRVDKIWTRAFRSDRVNLDEVNASFRRITEAALGELRLQGYQGEPEIHYSIDMRYLGQNYENEVPVEAGEFTIQTLQDAYAKFHGLHRAMYGYDIPKAVIEMINFKVTVVGKAPKPRLGQAVVTAADPERVRDVYFKDHGWLPTRIIRRQSIAISSVIAGPAIIEEDGSTTLVEPGMRLTRHPADILLLEVN